MGDISQHPNALTGFDNSNSTTARIALDNSTMAVQAASWMIHTLAGHTHIHTRTHTSQRDMNKSQ